MNLDFTLAAGETIQKRADSEKRYEIRAEFQRTATAELGRRPSPPPPP
jgi:hypothetical protein